MLKGTGLDFKRDRFGEKENREFAFDVASFANTTGGDLILGVDETAGVATSAPGLPVDLDLDKEILRYDGILESVIQPRIPGVRIWPVRDSSRAFIVVRIPRSVWGPHMWIKFAPDFSRAPH